MIKVYTTIEVNFVLDLEAHEVARTIQEAVDLELDGISVSGYDSGLAYTVRGVGDPGFRIEGANLCDLIARDEGQA